MAKTNNNNAISPLEQHLYSKCQGKATDLYAIWKFCKDDFVQILQTTITDFPHYSKHDSSHSDKIIDIIVRLLGGEKNIKKLSATDTFFILMAAYSHDIGMHLTYKDIDKLLSDEGTWRKIRLLQNSQDPIIAQAAKMATEYRQGTAHPPMTELSSTAKIIIADLMRGEHAKRSAVYIKDEQQLDELQTLEGGRSMLAKIDELHNESFYRMFNDSDNLCLAEIRDGYTGPGDDFHPRFVASLLRIGDLLDCDSNRFNPYAGETLKDLPQSSKDHQDKHKGTIVDRPRIAHNEICITINCTRDDVYRVAEYWKNMLLDELNNMRNNWLRIVPRETMGKTDRPLFTLPAPDQVKITLTYNNKTDKEHNPLLTRLRFDISGERTFELLKGGAIYKNPGRVFIREIVQNAIDATKLQIWQDLKDRHHLPMHLQNPDREIKTTDDIKFPDDIPFSVYEQYPINLSVEYDATKNAFIVICEDCGTGISEESLIRMTSQVGLSRKGDKEYEETLKEMPYFLRPTAAFGLGLQTVFYIADAFDVETQYPEEPTRHITFRQSTNGNYCSIEKEDFEFTRTNKDSGKKQKVQHGSTVRIEITSDKWGKFLELSDEEVEQIKTDIESIEYYISEKIDEYVKDNLSDVENMSLTYKSPFCEFTPIRKTTEFQYLKEETDFRVFGRVDGVYEKGTEMKHHYVFLIEEKKYGSRLIIYYNFPDLRANYYHYLTISLRGIRINNDMNSWADVGIDWDLYCLDSDRLVTISRDCFLPDGERWCDNALKELMPDIIRLTHDTLMCQNVWQYYHLCLTNWVLGRPIREVDLTPLKDFKPGIYNSQGKEVPAIKLFETNNIVVIDDFFDYRYKNLIKSLQLPKQSDFIVVDELSIPDEFVCYKVFEWTTPKKIHGYKQKFTCYCLTNKPKDNLQLVSAAELHSSSWSAQLIFGSEKYKEIVVGKPAPQIGKQVPYHGACWIYPPIIDLWSAIHIHELKDFKDFKKKLKKQKVSNEDIKLVLTKHIQKFVPDYIVKLIQKYNVLKNNKLTKEEIYATYCRLLIDEYLEEV